MKILFSLAASALAQFGGLASEGEKAFDFSAFESDGFNYDYGYDASAGYYYYDDASAGRPGASVDDERYFFTATPATTTTTTGTTLTITSTGSSCWKCDAMTFVSCASEGQMETCRLGDLDCCFVEVRVTDKNLQQLCTGCKDETACLDNQKENFSGRHDNDEQCRPEMIQQRLSGRHGGTQSVCRQCFKTCDPNELNGAFCFGGIDQTISPKVSATTGFNENGRFFTIPFTSQSSLISVDVITEATSDFHNAMGIPTHILVDQNDGHSNSVRDSIATLASNVYFGVSIVTTGSTSGTSGKTPDATGTNSSWQRDDMTYWSVLAADKAWWGSELKPLQQRRDLQLNECTQPTSTTVLYDGCPGATLETALVASGGTI